MRIPILLKNITVNVDQFVMIRASFRTLAGKSNYIERVKRKMIDIYLIAKPNEDDGLKRALWCRKDYWDANHAIEDHCDEVEKRFAEIGVNNAGEGIITWEEEEISDIDEIIEAMAERGINILLDDKSFTDSFVATFGYDPRIIDVYLVIEPEEDGLQYALWCRKKYWDANHAIEDGCWEVSQHFNEIGTDEMGDGSIAWDNDEMTIDDIIAAMAERHINILLDDPSFISTFTATFGHDPRDY